MNRGAFQFRGATLPETQLATLGTERIARVSLADVDTKADFLDAVALQLGFPDYFGKNLDALSDALSDLDTDVVVFEQVDNLATSVAEALAEILADLADTTLGPLVSVVCRSRRLKRLRPWPRL